MKPGTLGCLFAIALTGSVSAANWPQWGGPRGNGATDEKNLPVKWSATENVAWKATIGGLGVSSPIVAGTRRRSRTVRSFSAQTTGYSRLGSDDNFVWLRARSAAKPGK